MQHKPPGDPRRKYGRVPSRRFRIGRGHFVPRSTRFLYELDYRVAYPRFDNLTRCPDLFRWRAEFA